MKNTRLRRQKAGCDMSVRRAAEADDQVGVFRLYLGVFFIFAIGGFLIALCQEYAWGWAAGVFTAVFSGCIAVGWAYAISARRWWLLIPLNIIPFLAGPVIFTPLSHIGLFSIGAEYDELTRRITLAVLAVLSLTLGFVLVISFITQEERRAERLRTEIDLAQEIHTRLAPPIAFETHRVRVDAISKPTAEVGGDLLDALRDEYRTTVIVGDVTGHGVAAGVIMAMLKSAIRVTLKKPESVPLPQLLADLSQVITQLNAPGVFATLVAVRIPEQNRDFTEVALAGHHPVLWWRCDQKRLEEIENQSLPLGVAENEPFHAATIQPRPGDALVLFTDGIVETMNADSVQFGMRRLLNLVESAAPDSTNDMIELILTETAAWGPRSDDQTIAVVRFNHA